MTTWNTITLDIRDRAIGGTDRPLSTENHKIRRGESQLFTLPLDHVLPTRFTVVSVTSSLKLGVGVQIQAEAVGADTRSVDGQIVTTGTYVADYNLVAIQLNLSNGDVWEINVPVFVVR